MAQSDSITVLILAFAYIALALLALSSEEERDAPVPLTSIVSVVIRTLIVTVVIVAVFHFYLGVPLNGLLWTIPVLMLLLPGYDSNPMNAENPIGVLVSIALFIPLYPISRFILHRSGETRIPPVAQSDPVDTTPELADRQSSLIGEVAIALVPLRPTGTVSINGADYQAASESGMMIDEGTAIRVCGCRNSMLLVRKVEMATTA